MEFPDRVVIVPPVVEEEGIHFHSSLLDEFPTKLADSIDTVGLVVRCEITDVIPRVVMQERLIAPCPLALDVREKRPSHLTSRCDADYCRINHGRAGMYWECPTHGTQDLAALDLRNAHRVLNSHEEVSG